MLRRVPNLPVFSGMCGYEAVMRGSRIVVVRARHVIALNPARPVLRLHKLSLAAWRRRRNSASPSIVRRHA